MIWLLPKMGNSQSIVWERTLDVSNNSSGTRSQDYLTEIALFDTNSFFCGATCGTFGGFSLTGSGFYNPLVLKFNSNGSIIDTFVISDSVLFTHRIALDRERQHIWVAYRTSIVPYTRTVLEKLNLNGFTLVRRDFRGATAADSLPASIYKLLPSPDGGFYMLASRTRRVGSVSTEPWQISRFDSLGNRRWVREFTYTYVAGNPTNGEILPNGNLFVTGWAGREIYGLEIDTATGNAINRKILFTHPGNAGWSYSSVVRSPGGYYVAGIDFGSGPAQFLFARVNDSLRMEWGGFSSNQFEFPTAMTDSSVWVARRIEGGFYQYEKFDKDSTLLFRMNLTNNQEIGTNYTKLESIGHYTDQSALFGSTIQTATIGSPALHFTKIDSIGTPYNPVYPPVGPVLTSNQRQNQEPNLQVYPNPFTNTLRLSHKGTAQLLDVHGRVIISQPVEAGEELSVGNLPKGMYLLRLQSLGGKLYVRKVVRE